MNTSFERSKQTTDEWYTPKWIVDALGSFDLDPCAPENRLWNISGAIKIASLQLNN